MELSSYTVKKKPVSCIKTAFSKKKKYYYTILCKFQHIISLKELLLMYIEKNLIQNMQKYK